MVSTIPSYTQDYPDAAALKAVSIAVPYSDLPKAILSDDRHDLSIYRVESKYAPTKPIDYKFDGDRTLNLSLAHEKEPPNGVIPADAAVYETTFHMSDIYLSKGMTVNLSTPDRSKPVALVIQ